MMKLLPKVGSLLVITCCLAHADDLEQFHEQSIVIDTHSDFLDRSAIDGSHLDEDPPYAQTTLSKLKSGSVDAQFFSVFVPPAFEEYGYARRTMELIDRLFIEVGSNPEDIAFARSADEIVEISARGQIAALMGIEGGHSIEDSLALLRIYYRLGVRYMTLTWSNTNNWADSSEDEARWDGLNEFGVEVVRVMNDIGMMIDVSHVSDATFLDVLQTSRAPVIASHSLARSLTDTPQNISDELIRALAENGGVIQVSFYSLHVDKAFRERIEKLMAENADRFKEIETRLADDPIAQDTALWSAELALERSIPGPPMARVIDHIDHIVKLVGVDHVGIGSDFDGLGQPPEGLEHVGKLISITRELKLRGYSDRDIRKVLGGNLLRVMRAVEASSKHQ